LSSLKKDQSRSFHDTSTASFTESHYFDTILRLGKPSSNHPRSDK